MVEEIKLEKEVETIFEYITKGKNFLLSGGAGSGKTYSLVQVIKKAIEDNPTSKIACMTYTNAAVKEIEERVNHPNLSVTTIHDFLWDNIKLYQSELKAGLIQLINTEDSKIKSPTGGIVNVHYFKDISEGIQYKEWTKIQDGIISHDDVLELSNHLFKTYRLLSDILKDKYKFIFIDEYQDTHPLVIEIFLVHLKQSKKKNIIGFFGDSMQAIYDDGVGDLKKYILDSSIVEVQKKQNRRNPMTVIDLANRLRTDGLKQEPSEDITAPNMEGTAIKQGKIKFIYSKNPDLEKHKVKIGWKSDDTKETKELNLTHNLIAPKAGFGDLMEIYDRDKILDYKKRVTDYIKDNNITKDFSAYTFGQVCKELSITPTPAQQEFIDANSILFIYASNSNFEILKRTYLNKDSLIDDKKQDEKDESRKGSKRDNLIKHLFKIQRNIHFYKTKQYNEFLRRTEYQVRSVKDKINIKKIIEELDEMSQQTIATVIDFADQKGLCRKDDKYSKFINEYPYIFERVKQVKFEQFQNLFYYLEGFTPFSTQHKIKGAEFKNVLVVLDNGGWNNYNFEYLLNPSIYSTLTAAKKKSHPGILSRTQKIFYVCCTRAKDNLIIFYYNPDAQIIKQAVNWFGSENIVNLDLIS
ncbi:UvrD-helicase domain-containing protein [Flavobacterium sp. N502536]|uniref:UvrD-helicase domain-containing protein n=1 Tax=Flavobacterium sp. N502536 TaxID=2986837 RepID=UPI002223B289|nr:UvrD-helicase domain-containing protein [Flavobacterium sp. N502536]